MKEHIPALMLAVSTLRANTIGLSDEVMLLLNQPMPMSREAESELNAISNRLLAAAVELSVARDLLNHIAGWKA